MFVISEETDYIRSSEGLTNITNIIIPGNTTIVRFSHNQISFVPANYFKNLTSLIKIFLDHNGMTDIEDSAFSQVPSVRHIWINNNQLTVIREMMFSGVPNLSMLRLYANQIHTIEEGSFKENVALTTLDLIRNSLQVCVNYGLRNLQILGGYLHPSYLCN